MKHNLAREQMLKGNPAIGAEVSLGSPLSAEIISSVGFDFVVVDFQHGAWTEESATAAFRSIVLGGSIPMARVRKNDYSLIGRLLDLGVMGIIVPMVNSVEDAQAAAFATRYPPQGGRSNGAFATGYLGNDYEQKIDNEVFLAVQIETGIAQLRSEEIMAVEGIDACWIGPMDLARTKGLDLKTEDGQDQHVKAITAIVESCIRAGKIPGIALGDPEIARFWIERGCLFVTTGTDASWARDGAVKTFSQLKS